MSIQISNRRNQIRRSSTPGVAPTIPSSASTYYPDTTWVNSDIMVGELFMNTTDSRVWFRDNVGIHELGFSGQTGNFLSLSDVPNTFDSGKYLQVNTSATSLIWVDAPIDTNAIISMTDFYPNSIDTGYTGYSIVVDAAGTGFTLENITPYSLLTLSDTPTGYTANYITKVNSAADGLEFVDGSNLYVELTGNQIVEGKKNFLNTIKFEEDLVVSDIIFSGITNVNITEITTDTGFTSINDTTLATTSAIYGYVNSLIYGTGSTDGFVTLDTTQTITGEKTFSNSTHFADIDATGVEVSGNVNLGLTSYQYFGDAVTDGSFRMYLNATGDLQVDKRVSGVWTFRCTL